MIALHNPREKNQDPRWSRPAAPIAGGGTSRGSSLGCCAFDDSSLDTNTTVEGAREAIRRLIRDGTRAADVIHRVRALFSRRDFTLEQVDLNELTREVVGLSVDDLQKHKVVVRADLEEALPITTVVETRGTRQSSDSRSDSSSSMAHTSEITPSFESAPKLWCAPRSCARRIALMARPEAARVLPFASACSTSSPRSPSVTCRSRSSITSPARSRAVPREFTVAQSHLAEAHPRDTARIHRRPNPTSIGRSGRGVRRFDGERGTTRGQTEA